MRKLSATPAALAIAMAALLGGCGLVYKVDVYQGSLLDKKQVDQLKTGQTKRQVYALLGSPAVQDPFHQSQWDYVASVQKRGGEREVKNLVLTFDGETLASIEGDYFPEQDLALERTLRGRYGNLARDKDKDRRGRTR
ncbi:MAG: outer membrane protein assembly factor BamE [Chiayiivirga sp.]|uniref:outer membrane protein assembly factor BamE n=1 Tax=Chiayiivirga sp. TaxID=2041042 RepID=UPI0025C5C93C|nr:outer membrane protein assembly factor BamE [Chiayiivirga sp.]MCI1709896.1 outer membrane protein assembly factor BamE [Chiayiivirga sp.]MCI1729793.1 outer membrane protein assembly factor BamE [Chiayiivirga sp.]